MSRRNQPSFGQRVIAGFLVLTQMLWLPPSLAATYYWDADANAANNTLPATGLGGSGVWDVSSFNWWDGSAVLGLQWTNSGINSAIFTGTAGTVSLAAPITAGGLTFGTGGYTIAGAADLTLAGPQPMITVTNAGTLATVQTDIVLAAPAAFGGAGDLLVSGSLFVAPALSGGLPILTKFGTGTLTLSGDNSGATLATNITGGRVSIASSANLANGRVTLNGGGLESTGTTTLVNGFTLGTAGGSFAVSSGQTLTIGTNGIIGPGGLTKSDTGTLALAAGSTYPGTTVVNEGTLVLNSTTALPVRSPVTVAAGATLDVQQVLTMGSLSGGGLFINSSASNRVITVGRDDTSTTFTGQISPATAARVAITKIGAGTLTLAPTAASTYTGNTILNGGSLKLDFTVGSLTSMLAATPLQIAGGSLTVIGRNSGGAIAQTVGAFTVGATGGAIIMDPNGSALGTQLTTGALAATAAGGALLIQAPANTSVRIGSALNTAGSIGRLVFTADGTAFDWATNTGSTTNTIALGSYTDVAGTTVTGTDTNNSRISSAVAAEITTVGAGGWTTNSLKIDAGAAGQSLALGGNNLTLTTGGLLFTGANNYTISGGAGVLRSNTATNSDLIVSQYGAGELTISAIIANGIGASTLTKAGPGVLTLAGANTFTGAVFVSGGTLSFSNVANGAGGLGAGVATAVTIRDGATLRYTGASGTIAAAASAGSHTFALQGGNATIEVTNPATALTLAGAISGAGSLVKTGAGVLEITGAASHSGSTIINEGTLRITAADRLPSTPVFVAAGATLDLAAGNETVGSLSGGGTVFAGTTARTLNFGADHVSSTFTGLLTGAAAHVLTKSGNGVMTLNMSTMSAWTGTTAIAGGIIRLGASNQLNTGAALTVGTGGGATQFDLNGFDQTLGGTTALNLFGTGATATSMASVSLGGGILTLGGNLTVNSTGNNLGATIYGAGALSFGSGTRTITVNNSTSVPDSQAELVISSTITSTGGGLTKSGLGNMKLTGANTYTGTSTFNSGTTYLDYSIENNSKIGTGALALVGGHLVLEGNGSADTVQTVASTTFASGGASTVTLRPGGGQELVLNLGALTRAASAGTVRFNLPGGDQTSSNGFTTATLNNTATGLLGSGAAFATVTDASGTYFAANATNIAGGNIAAAATTAADSLAAWTSALNVTDSAGYSGTLAANSRVNSLRFNAAGPSTVTIGSGDSLSIVSGGILQTSAVTGGVSTITGGRLTSESGSELIFIVDSLSQRLFIESAIQGVDAITKSGDGTLTLAGNNSSTGAVRLQAGTLELTGGNAIGDNAPVTFLNAGSSPTLSLLAGQTETIGTLSGGGTNTSALVLIGANATLTVNQAAAGTYSSLLAGGPTSTFVKSGAGTLTLQANSTGYLGQIHVNQGTLLLSGNFNQLSATTGIVVSGSSSIFQINNDQTTATNSKIPDTTPITLNNTAGGGGLVNIRNGGTTSAGNETVGQLILGAGHNMILADGTGTSRIGAITFSNAIPLQRDNLATLLVIGRNLGDAAATQKGVISFSADPGGAVGGGTVSGTTMSILPYVVGETIGTMTTPDAAVNFGNSFVRYVSLGAGLQPLAPSDYVTDKTAYDALAAGVLANNIRFTASASGLASDTTGINSLVLDSATGITVIGPAQSLEITSGAILSAGAGANSLTGFTGITTGGARPYYIYVTNPAGSLTVDSAFATTQPLVKSGAGTLILGNPVGNAFTDLHFNQGVVQASALNQLGTGNLNFFGGVLRFGGVFDPSARTITIGTGGGTFDTNGNDIFLANSFGNNGVGSFTKTGAGTLTLNGVAGYSGGTFVSGGTLALGISGAISNAPLSITSGGTVALGSQGATVTSLALGAGAANSITGSGTLTVSGDATVNQGSVSARLAGEMNLIKQTAAQTVTLSNSGSTYAGYTHVQNGVLSVYSVANAGAASSLGAPTGTDATILLGLGAAAGTLAIDAAGSAGTTNRRIDLFGTTGGGVIDNDGTAALVLTGGISSSTAGAKTLTLSGSTTGFKNIISGAITNGLGTVAVTKTEAGVWELAGVNTYTGTTTVNGGSLIVSGTVNNGAGTTSIGSAAGTSGLMRIVPGADYQTTTFSIGGNATGVGSLVITGGTVATTTASTSSGVSLGAAGYGGLFLSGGSISTRRFENNSTAGTSVYQISGGTLTSTEYIILRNNRWEFTVTGGEVIHNAASQNIALGYDGAGTGGPRTGVMTVAGGLVDNTGRNVSFGQANTVATTSSLNLNAGTLITNAFTQGTMATSYVNFNGGTLKAAIDTAAFLPGMTGVYINGAFGAYGGGAIIDTNGKNITVAANLLAPTGNGVSGLSVGAAGSGYIGAPYVEITGGGGTGATGYATVDLDPASATFGQVTGVVLTNPGVGYTSTPTVTLVGGGGAGASIDAAGLMINISGGLQKIGNGTLTLSGANTFTGATVVGGGTLSAHPGAVAGTSSLTVGGAANASFNLYQDGVGAAWNMNVDAGIILGTATTSGALGFNLGTTSDRIILSGTGELIINSGGGFIDAVAVSGFGVGSYELISGAAAITGFENLKLRTLPSGYQYSLSATASSISLNVLNISPAGDLYWTGEVNNSWGGLSGSNSNWATVPDGATDAGYAPGPDNIVHFSATNASGSPITTTLDSPVSLQGLKFVNSGTGAVTIAAGVGGSLTVGSGGIEMQTGTAPAAIISAPVILSAAQTWTVADAGSQLTISGAMSGGQPNSTQAEPGQNVSLTIKGAGAVALASTGNTFTGDILVDGGTFIVDSDRDWGGSTVASTTSKSVMLANGGKLAVTANVNPGAATTTNYNLVRVGSGGGVIDVGNGFTLTLDDAGQLYGNGNLTKAGAGTLLLGNAFTNFTGSLISVANGELRLQNTQALGASGSQAAVTLAEGVTLRLRNNTSSNFNSSLVTVNGNVTVVADRTSAGGAITHTAGPLSIGDSTMTVGHGLFFNADTTGSVTFGAVTLTGSPTFMLNNVNGSGIGTLTLGAMNLGSNTLTFEGGAHATLSGIVSGPGGIVKENTGNLTLGGVANSFAGGILVKAGTLIGGNNASTFGDNSNVITLGDSAGSANVTLQAINSFTYMQPIVVASGNTGLVSIVAGTTTGNVVFAGSITLMDHGVTLGKIGTTGSSQFTGGITGVGDVIINNTATTGTITLATGLINPTGSITHASTATGTTTISAVIGSNVTGVTQNSTTSQLTLSGNNLYTGMTTIAAGTTLSIGSGGASGSVLGDILNNGTLIFNRSDASTYSGVVSGAGAVNKLGTGTTTLSGANTYSGVTTISGGALAGNISGANLILNGGVFEGSSFARTLGAGAGQVQWTGSGGFSALGEPLSVTLAGAADPLVWGGTQYFLPEGASLILSSITADDVVTFSNNIDLNGAQRTVQVLDNTGFTTDGAVLSGILSGTGSLAKTGAGPLELTGANTYSGSTLISAGALTVSSLGRTGSASSNLGSGNAAISIGSGSTTAGILIYTGSGEKTDRALVLAATTTGGATVTSSGTGALEWEGNVTSAGTTKTFTLNGDYAGAANVFSGVISIGTGNLAKNGLGTWELTSANTFGNTNIGSATLAGGTLRLKGAGTLGSGSLTIANGTLDVAGDADVTVTALTLAGGAAGASSTISLGAGRTLMLGGSLTYSATNNNLTATIGGSSGAAIDLGGAARSFIVGNSTGADIDLLIGANVTLKNGSLIKTNAGTMHIEGVNELTSVEITASALSGNLGAANLSLNGGVYQGSGAFTRALGVDASQVQWLAGNGGFAARGGAFSVDLNSGASDPLIWGGTAQFVSAGQLLFGSLSADNVVTFQNDINLNNTGGAVTRTVQVVDNPASSNDKAVLAGNISGVSAAMTKSGNGTLELTGANSYDGLTTISAGTLITSGSNSAAGATTLSAGNLMLNSNSNGGLASGLLTLTAGTLQALGEERAIANDVLLTAVTITGNENLSLGGTTTGNGAGNRVLTNNIGTGSIFTLAALSISNNASVRSLTLAGTGDTLIAGVIGNGSATTGSMIFNNTGVATLSGASTYNGTTAIQNGAVRLIGGSDRLPVSTVVTLGSGLNSGVLVLGDAAVPNGNVSQTLSGLLTSGTGASNRVVGGSANDGSTANNATLTLNIVSGTSTYNGLIGGHGLHENNINLVKAGLGALVLTQDLSDWTRVGEGSGPSDPLRPTLTIAGGILTLTATATLNTRVIVDGGIFNDQGFTRGPNFSFEMSSGLITLNGDDDFTTVGLIATTRGVAALNFDNSLVSGYNGSSMYLGAVGARSFTGGSLAAGAGNTYRFGGGAPWNSVLTATTGGSGGNLRVTTANVVTGANNVIIGDNGSYNNNLGLYGGNSTVEFTAAQDYTGTTTLAGGTLIVTNANQLGTPAVSAGSIILDGGILRYGAGFTTDLSARIVIDSGGTIDTDANVTFASGLANADTGTSSAISHPGVNGAGGLIKNGAGTLTLTGNSTYAGATVVNRGTLQLNRQTGSLNSASGLTFGGPGTFRLDNTGATGTLSQTLGALTFGSGDGVILSQRTAAQSTNLTFASFSRSPGATGNFTIGGTGSSASINKVIFASAPATGVVLNPGLYFGGVDFAVYDAAGYVRALNYASDPNAATATAGATIGAVSGKDVNVTGAITAQTNLTINSLKLANNAFAIGSGQTLTITSGAIIKTGATATISGGTLAAPGELIVRQSASGDALTISSVINSGTGVPGNVALTKSGAGTLTLSSSTNAINGQIVINGGTLSVDAVARIAGSTGITLDGGNFTLTGNESLPRLFTLGLGGGTITLNSTSGSANFGSAGDVLQFAGLGARTLVLAGAESRVKTFLPVIGDNGGPTSLTIAGGGDVNIISLSAANTYTGTTTITRGVLRVANASALPGGLGGTTLTSANTGGGNLIFNGGAGSNRAILEFNDSVGDLTRSVGAGFDQIQWLGNGGFSNQSASTRIVNLGGEGAVLTWGSGGFVPTGSRLQFSQAAGNSNLSGGTIDFQNGIFLGGAIRTIEVAKGQPAVDAIISGDLTSTSGGGVTKLGNGSLVFTGVNNTGTTTTLVTAGTLHFATTQAIPGASGETITVTGGTGSIGLAGSVNPLLDLGARIAASSTGGLALDTSSAAVLDFSTGNTANMRLTAYNPDNQAVYFTGQIIPNGGTYRFGSQTLTVGSAAAATTLVLPVVNTLTGNRSVDLAPGNLTLTASQDYSGGTFLNTTLAGNTSAVGIGSDAAFGTGTITIGGANTVSFGAVNGDRVVANRIINQQAGSVAFVVSGNSASDGVANNANQGAITYTGTLDLNGRATSSVLHSRTSHASLFLGDITNTTNGVTYANSTAGLFSILTTPEGASSKSYSGQTTINDNGVVVIDHNSSLGASGNLFMGSGTGTSTLRIQPGVESVSLAASRNIILRGDSNHVFQVGYGSTLTLNGVISSSAANAGARTLTKLDNGMLVVTNKNTYAGAASNANSLVIRGGTLRLDSSAGAFTAASDRFFPDAANPLAVAFSATTGSFAGGGTLEILQGAANGFTLTQGFGNLTFHNGANTIRLTNLSTTQGLVLNVGTTFTRNAGATLNIATSTAGGSVSLNSNVSNANGIIGGYVTFNGIDWATQSGGAIIALPSGSYTSGLPASGSTVAGNYLETASQTVTASQTIQSLKFAPSGGAQTITVNSGVTQTVTSGGLLYDNTGGPATITGAGQWGATGADVIVHTYGSGDTSVNKLTLSGVIKGSGTSVTKAGPGTLVMAGTNTYTGALIINEGIVEYANGSATGQNLGSPTAGAANILLNGGTLRQTATNNLIFGITVNGRSTIDVPSGVTLTQTAQSINGSASVTGILQKTGAGTLAVTGGTANGNLSVEVNAGIFNLGKTNVLAVGENANGTGIPYAALIINSGATARLTGTGGNQVGDASSVVVKGTGVWDLNGASGTATSESIDGLAGNGFVRNNGILPFTLMLGANNSSSLAPYTVGAAAAGVAETGLNNFLGVIQTNIAVTKIGAGTQILSGNNTYTGSTTIRAGTLKLGIGDALPSGAGKGDVFIEGNNSGAAVGGVAAVLSPGTLDLGGFDQAINGLNSTTGGFITSTPNGSSIISVFTLGNNDASGSFNGIIQNGYAIGADSTTAAGISYIGQIRLVKDGAGTQILSGASAYSGGTVVSGGALIVNNTIGSGTGAGTVTVNAGAVLGGVGSISGDVVLSGILAPGSASTGLFTGDSSEVGQLKLTSLTINAGGTLQVQLGGATVFDPENVALLQNDPGSFVVPASWTSYEAGSTEHDQLYLSAAGAPNLDGLTIQILPEYLNSFSPAYGQIFQIMDWASLGANDATGVINWNLPTLDGYSWDHSLFLSHGVIAVIPEPSRALLLFFGLVGLALRRRRRTA